MQSNIPDTALRKNTDDTYSIQTTETGATTMQTRGTEDVAGADTYTTILTPTADATHVAFSVGGTANDAIISFDGGTTEHMVVPAGSAWALDNVTIRSGVAIQMKNKTAGQNYVNGNVSVW